MINRAMFHHLKGLIPDIEELMKREESKELHKHNFVIKRVSVDQISVKCFYKMLGEFLLDYEIIFKIDVSNELAEALAYSDEFRTVHSEEKNKLNKSILKLLVSLQATKGELLCQTHRTASMQY